MEFFIFIKYLRILSIFINIFFFFLNNNNRETAELMEKERGVVSEGVRSSLVVGLCKEGRWREVFIIIIIVVVVVIIIIIIYI